MRRAGAYDLEGDGLRRRFSCNATDGQWAFNDGFLNIHD